MDAPASFPIAMSDAEVQCLRKHLARARRYLEFGSGGSTAIASAYPITQVVSVETDLAWINKMSAHQGIAKRLEEGTLRFHHVDVGPTATWGWPSDDATAIKWPAYYRDIWLLEEKFDLILVDGRFRLACALSAILHATPGTKILIHDFERDYYHPVLRFVDRVYQVERLAVLRVRRWGVNYRELAKLLSESALDRR